MTITPVIYTSPTWGVHDQRWVGALEAGGFTVRVLAADPNLRREVENAEPLEAPVLAGPLTSVTSQLVGLKRRVVGLSWGFDLQPDHSASAKTGELAWLPQLDALIVDSPSTRQEALAVGLSADRIHLIPWGIELDKFTPTGARTDFGFPPGSRVLLSLRTHDDLYRTADVVEAFAQASQRDPKLVLVMGGSGPLTANHRERIDALGLSQRVAFIGQVDEADIAPLLRAADLYVTASETDGTSVTLLQAMACRTPVIASQTAGNAWWIADGETGRTFPVGDVPALAALMVDDLQHAADLDQAARLVHERADWNKNRMALTSIMLGSVTDAS
jgi:glycosyltransferase involved in cell wall biosynthesis